MHMRDGRAVARRHAGARAAAWTVTTLALIALGQAPGAAATVVHGGTLVPVVIEGVAHSAAAEVTRLGGVLDHRPPMDDGLRARVPVASIAALDRVDGVRSVRPDGPSGSLRTQGAAPVPPAA